MNSNNSSGTRSPNGSYPRSPAKLVPWYLNDYNIAMVAVYVFLITAAIVGNLLICAAICINVKLRKNVASYFIVSLAIADLCTASFSMPFDLESYITYGRWMHGKVFCVIWSTVYLVTVPVSMWNLFVLSIERYKTLKNPWDRFRVTPFMTPRRALLVIAVLWIYSLTFALIPLMGWNYKPPRPRNPNYCYFDVNPSYAIFSAFLNFYFPMFAMCFIYYKIYEIARTQYMMPSGLALKTKSLPSRAAEDEPPKERQGMNNGNRYDHESCKASGAGVNIEKNGVANLGLEIENADKLNRTKTFMEVLEDADNEVNQMDQNDEGIEQDMKDGGDNESGMGEDVSQARLEGVSVHVKEDDEEEKEEEEKEEEDDDEKEEEEKEEEKKKEEEKGKEQGEKSGTIPEDIAQEKDQTKDQTNLDHPEDFVNGNTNNIEEKANNSLALPRHTGASQQDTNEEDNPEENLEEGESQDTANVTPKDESLESEEHKEIGRSCSVQEQQEDQDLPSSSEEQAECVGSPNHATVSLEMQTYLRKKVLTDEDREKSSSRDSLQSTCTLQSTLPHERSSVLARGGHEHIHELSASRDTLNSAFGSMEDLTKRRKIFVKNKKAARTISIILSKRPISDSIPEDAKKDLPVSENSCQLGRFEQCVCITCNFASGMKTCFVYYDGIDKIRIQS